MKTIHSKYSPELNEPKATYEKPEMQVYELEIEGVIAASVPGSDPDPLGYDDAWG